MTGRNRAPYERAFKIDATAPLKLSQVTKILHAIWDEHSERTRKLWMPDDGGDTKNESARNFLRREVYALAWCLRNAPPAKWEVKDIYYKNGGRTTHPEVLDNMFHALMLCIYESDQGISRQERSLMSQELEYAYRHKIQPELLCGFLYQSTDRKKLGDRLATGFIEPAFRSERV